MDEELEPDKYYIITSREVRDGVVGKLTIKKFLKPDGTWGEKELRFLPEGKAS